MQTMPNSSKYVVFKLKQSFQTEVLQLESKNSDCLVLTNKLQKNNILAESDSFVADKTLFCQKVLHI